MPMPLHDDRLTTTGKRLVVVFGLLLAGACDSPSTIPSPLPTPAPVTPLPAGASVRVTGRVIDERGVPIGGAAVSSVQPDVSTATGADGSYDLSGPFGSAYGFWLMAIGPGYEPNYQWVLPTAEPTLEFRLRAVVRVTAGQGLTVAVDAGDTLYGAAEQYRARPIRVVAPATGNLVVEGSSRTGHAVLFSDREYEYYPCCPSRLGLAVSAGQEIKVHVLTYGPEVPAEFSVTTRLEVP